MRQRTIELVVGLFMLAGIIALLMLALKVSGLNLNIGDDYYVVTASFGNIGGLKVRAPISLAGVKVGYVSAIKLDRKTYRADVTLALKKGVAIPDDSSASILTEGLLGSNYIGITPGYKEDMLKEDGKITNTHPAIILENLIGQLLFNVGEKD